VVLHEWIYDKCNTLRFIFTNQQCKIEDGLLKFQEMVGLEVKTRLENVTFREVRIIPQCMGYVIEIVYEKDIKKIENVNAKSERIMGIDIGLRNNQNFVQIPFSTLINQIKYKAEEAGIQVMVEDEDHTSKCSFLDSESIEDHDEYMGKRIKRGIFRSKNGILIHAGLQASCNMIRRAVPEAFADVIEGIGLYTRSLNIPKFMGMITSKGGCLTWLTEIITLMFIKLL